MSRALAEPMAVKATTRLAERPPGRPDRSLDLATIPGAAHPTPSAHRPQLAAANAKPLDAKPRDVKSSGANSPVAKSLPPARPVLAGNSAEAGRKHQLKTADKAEPSAKPARQRVVSLRPNAEPSLR